ncbi:hypothetical protein [Microbacterium paraoxydans]|uniref:hypothetical protein n=1 Tax=Microbacterium paraoxydans TaxID=199592 RepID=UPI001C2C7196|nr:hypothetical protein [Microbacterium paraoxydans]QXE28557.1 hypothetical protein IZR02_09030 [Microbacterium paraoxydans]
MAEWYTATSDEAQQRLIAAWPDAPIENLEVCGFLLETARIQVLAYAPETATLTGAVELALVRFGLAERLGDVLALLGVDPTDPPINFVYAQLQQATNLWNAGRVSGGGDAGMEQFTFTPRPLDKTIKQIIRPVQGGPRVR